MENWCYTKAAAGEPWRRANTASITAKVTATEMAASKAAAAVRACPRCRTKAYESGTH